MHGEGKGQGEDWQHTPMYRVQGRGGVQVRSLMLGGWEEMPRWSCMPSRDVGEGHTGLDSADHCRTTNLTVVGQPGDVWGSEVRYARPQRGS